MKEQGLIIIDGDEQLLLSSLSHENKITCGFNTNNDVLIHDINVASDQTSFQLNESYGYSIPLLVKHHAKNATYAIILGEKLKIPVDIIRKSLSSLKLTSMRFEFLKGKNNVSIINDAYNASPTSMIAAIDVVKQLEGYHQKVLILGSIFELGKKSKELHKSIASIIEPPITAVLTIGDDAESISIKAKQIKPDITCKHFES